jgi:hypothetical protein
VLRSFLSSLEVVCRAFAGRQLKRFAILICAAAAAAANAQTTAMVFDTHFSSNSQTPATPWLTATFADLAAGTATIALRSNGLSPNQRVDSVFLNLATISPSSLSFTHVSGPVATVSVGQDSFKAASGGNFDIRLSYGNAPAPNAFVGNQTSIYRVSAPGLTAGSFSELSSGRSEGSSAQGSLYAAAKVVAAQHGSTWVTGNSVAHTAPAPEPEIYATLLAGLALIGFVVRRRRKP